MSSADSSSAPRPTLSLGVFTILLTLLGWTSIPLFLEHFTDLIDPWTANGWRYGFSALMWLPVLVWRFARKDMPAGLWTASLPASLFNIAAQVCFGLAPYYIDPGLMTFALRLQIVFVMFGAAVMFASERSVIRSPLFIAGISMLLSGTLLTLVFKQGGLGDARSTMGVGIAISSGVLYAGYSLSVRKFMHGIPAFTAFSAVSQYTGVALLLLMLALGDKSGLLLSEVKKLQAAGEAVPREWLLGGAGVFALNSFQVFLLLLSAIVGIGMGHTLYYYSIQRLGLAVATGVVQLQPVTVSICSVLIFAEPLKPIQWVTGIIAICGAILMLAAQQVLSRRATARANVTIADPD